MASVLAIVAAPYRLERVKAFLDPWQYASDEGYQTIQSLYALGSGGIFGLGLGRSRQKFFYLPEQHTDFIYAILGEELGFIGTFFVIMLFLLLVWRGFRIAMNAPDNFSSLLAAGLTGMIVLQAAINIGVVIGALPVTGITLPFISYGGSSLLFSMISVGIILNISRYNRT
jgi:cell division protein FtsW